MENKERLEKKFIFDTLNSLKCKNSLCVKRNWNQLNDVDKLKMIIHVPMIEKFKFLKMTENMGELIRKFSLDEFLSMMLNLDIEESSLLLAFSSTDQINYFFDIMSWVGDELKFTYYEKWLPLLFEENIKRFEQWICFVDLEILILLCKHWFEVIKYFLVQENQEIPDDIPPFTLDGVYFLKIYNVEFSPFVVKMLRYLQENFFQIYKRLMEGVIWEPNLQLMEDACKWKQGRLTDCGFPDKLEALGVWNRTFFDSKFNCFIDKIVEKKTFLSKKIFFKLDKRKFNTSQKMLLHKVLFETKEKNIDYLYEEMMYISNCGLVALETDLANSQEVSFVISESLALISLGLELVSEENGIEPEKNLCCIGMDCLLTRAIQELGELRKFALSVLKKSWLKKMPTGLKVLDFPLNYQLEGFLFYRPRYFLSNLDDSFRYRFFHNLNEIRVAKKTIRLIEFWGKFLFRFMGVDFEAFAKFILKKGWPEDRREIKISMIIATWVVCQILGISELKPLPLAQLSNAVSFFQSGLPEIVIKKRLEDFRRCERYLDLFLVEKLLLSTIREIREGVDTINFKKELKPEFISNFVLEL